MDMAQKLEKLDFCSDDPDPEVPAGAGARRAAAGPEAQRLVQDQEQQGRPQELRVDGR